MCGVAAASAAVAIAILSVRQSHKRKNDVCILHRAFELKGDREIIQENSSISLRVLQFNVLAKHLSSAPEFGGFIKCPRRALDYEEYRRPRVLEEMTRFSPDIITAQELDNEQFRQYFKAEMESTQAYVNASKNLASNFCMG